MQNVCYCCVFCVVVLLFSCIGFVVVFSRSRLYLSSFICVCAFLFVFWFSCLLCVPVVFLMFCKGLSRLFVCSFVLLSVLVYCVCFLFFECVCLLVVALAFSFFLWDIISKSFGVIDLENMLFRVVVLCIVFFLCVLLFCFFVC